MRLFVGISLLFVLSGVSLPAQDTIPVAESTVVIPPSPPPPTPEQTRYLDGLRTAGRGVAQLKSGVDRVVRYRATADTLRLRQAGSRLAGLCTAARGFMASGRAQMTPVAYADSTRLKARSLASQIDTLIRYMPTCETLARRVPARTAGELGDRLQAYYTFLRDFRTAIGLPNR